MRTGSVRIGSYARSHERIPHRDRRPDQGLHRQEDAGPRRDRRLLHRRARRARRLPRSQRRRQIDDSADADHPDPAHLRPCAGRRPRHPLRRGRGTRTHRVCRSAHERQLLAAPTRRAAQPGRLLRHVASGQRPASGRAHRLPRSHVLRDPQCAAAQRRTEAPTRHRARTHARTSPHLPRRALHRTRPAEPGEPLGAHPRPAHAARHHGVPHHALSGRGRPLRRAGDGDGQGADHRRRRRRLPQGDPCRRRAHLRIRGCRRGGERPRRGRPSQPGAGDRGRAIDLPRRAGRRPAAPGDRARTRRRRDPGPSGHRSTADAR